MGSFTNGVYVPTIGEVGWGTNVNDFLTRSGEEYINVKQSPYGAKGDGTTDDTAAIQAAIDVVSAANGGTVYFPPSNQGYKVTATITVSSPYGSGAKQGMKLLGGNGTTATRGSGVASSALWWGGGSSTSPVLEIREAYGVTVEGMAVDANNGAKYGLRVLHAAGDTISPHLTTFRNCTFQLATQANVIVGAEALATGFGADACCIKFEDCYFATAPGGVAGNTAIANFIGSSGNALPVNFINCEFSGNRVATQYHLKLTGGTYNLYGCLSAGATLASFYLGSEGATVPPNLGVFGYEAQGDAALLLTSAGGSSAAPQRATTLNGVFCGSDGGLAMATDSIQWGFGTHANLTLSGVRLYGNLNVTDAAALVFVNGLQFTDVTGSVTGQTSRVAGFWYDGTSGGGSLKWYAQTPGAFKVYASTTGNRAGAPAVGQGAVAYDTTLNKPIWSDGTNWRDAAGTVV